MKLLILGGTIFLGRHLVEAALAHGHEVTLFNRGQHNSELFPEVEKLHGNRDGGLDVLRGRRWDAVVDTCGYVPRVVRASAELLADAVEHYTFISSISVYADLGAPGTDEEAPVATLEDETVEAITNETYGALKALCEQAVAQVLPGRTLNLRPGLIVGPYDYLDRFSYWVTRVARGGDLLAPGSPQRQVQIIDARDLAEWNLRMIEARQTGTYNATGPDYRLTIGKLLDTCQAVSGSDARFVWVDESFLLEHQVEPWSELPIWVPADYERLSGVLETNCKQAFAAGLTFRPLAETIRDTLAWNATRPAERELNAGMKPEREAQLLANWQAAQAAQASANHG